MVDLDDAGRRLAAYRAGPLTPVPELRRRVRRRTRRRQGARGLVVGAVIAVIAVGAFNLPSRQGRNQQVQVGGVGAGPVRSLPTVAHPKGWDPVDVGLLRLWTPPGGSTGYQPGSFTFSSFGACLPRTCAPRQVPLIVERSVSTAGFRRTSFNGTPVWVRNDGHDTVYDVPSLRVRLVAYTPLARQVARTLGPSSLSVVLANSYSGIAPSGWRTIRFDGVAASIPATWPVTTLSDKDNCNYFFEAPRAYVGNLHSPCDGIGNTNPPPTVLWLGDAYTSLSQDETTIDQLDTGNASVDVDYNRTGGAYLVDLTIRTSTGTVRATIGLGVDPTITEEILNSIRSA